MLKDFEHILAIIVVLLSISAGTTKLFKPSIVRWRNNKMKRDVALDKMPDLLKAVDFIVFELRPNHGTSLKDAVNRIDSSVSSNQSMFKSYLNMDARPMFIVDTEGSMIWCNRAYGSLLQRDTADLLGHGFWSSLHESSIEESKERVDDFVRDRVARGMDSVTFVLPDKSLVSAEALVYPIVGPDGVSTGVIGYLEVKEKE